MKPKFAIFLAGWIVLIPLLMACGGDANPLAGTAWQLTEISGAPVVAGTTFTANFEANQVGGQACNSYGGEYTLRGETIRIGQVAATEMYCTTPEGIMDQEAAYMRLLLAAQSYTLAEGRLTIFAGEGQSLIFEPVR